MIHRLLINVITFTNFCFILMNLEFDSVFPGVFPSSCYSVFPGVFLQVVPTNLEFDSVFPRVFPSSCVMTFVQHSLRSPKSSHEIFDVFIPKISQDFPGFSDSSSALSLRFLVISYDFSPGFLRVFP